MLEARKETEAKIERAFREMEQEARAALISEGFKPSHQRHERLLAVRYQGQSFELEIKWTRGGQIAADFHKCHHARYGYAQEANRVEVVSLRLRSSGIVEKIRAERASSMTGKNTIARPRGFAQVHFAERPLRASIYARDDLKPGARLQSPCVVTEYSATTLILPDARARVDEHGNLIIES